MACCPLSAALGGLSLGASRPAPASLGSRCAAPAQLSMSRSVAPRAARLGAVQVAAMATEVRPLIGMEGFL